MRFATSAALALAAPLFVSAAPIRRQSALTPAQQQDLTVLNFANVLNELEMSFYMQAVAKFSQSDITSAGFTNALLVQQQISNIVADEGNHINALSNAIQNLGQQPLGGCNFDFTSALTDINTTLATARVVENVGVSAFLGAAHLVSDPLLLTDAASILTVEARHSSILDVLSGTGQAIPQAFDIALTPPQVLAIASPFISGCNLGVTANPTLAVNAPLSQGSSIQFNSSALPSDTSSLSCQMIVGGVSQAIVSPFSSCTVPSNMTGPVAIFVTNSSTPLDTDVVTQDPSSIVAGPAFTFIDAQAQTLGVLVRNVGQSLPSDSSSSTPSNDPSGVTVNGSNSTVTSSTGSNSTVSGSNGTTTAGVTGAVTVNPACNANPADTNNAVAPGGTNTYVGPSANCVFTIGAITNQPALTASPFVNDTTVSGPGASVTAPAPAAASTTAA